VAKKQAKNSEGRAPGRSEPVPADARDVPRDAASAVDAMSSAATIASERDGGGEAGRGDAGQASPPALMTITVRGPKKGRRRAGFVFGPVAAPVTVTPDQKKAIEDDPRLTIV
jgi:hypothetical protein